MASFSHSNTTFGGFNQGFDSHANGDHAFSGTEGGGFVQQSPFQNDESGTSRRGGISIQTMRPVTIRQILGLEQEHADANLKLDGHELTQITFVANVRKSAQQTTYTAYTLEDGTGAVEARRMTQSQNGLVEEEHIADNTYVRVVANVRFFANKCQVYISKIKPVTDMNEITFHFLNAIHTHLELTRGSAPQAPGKTAGMDFGLSKDNPYQAASATAMSFGGDNTGNLGFTPIQDKVLQLAQNYMDRDEGVHINVICQQLRNAFSPTEVQQTVEWLSNEGHLYNTVDDQHVKCTFAP
ncbi:Replication factor A protein 2 [Dispira simplex]|nr:Replication factor A protein 2 [Dispira simplex]